MLKLHSYGLIPGCSEPGDDKAFPIFFPLCMVLLSFTVAVVQFSGPSTLPHLFGYPLINLDTLLTAFAMELDHLFSSRTKVCRI